MRGRGGAGQYIPSAQRNTSSSTTVIAQNNVTTFMNNEGVTFVCFLTTVEPGGMVAAQSILSFMTPYAPTTIASAHSFAGSHTVFLHFQNATTANAFIQVVSTSINGVYADSFAVIMPILPVEVTPLGN